MYHQNRTGARQRPGTLKVMDTLSYTPDAQNLPADPTGRRGLLSWSKEATAPAKPPNSPCWNEALSARGYRVITTREPGGTEIGEKLRPSSWKRSGHH